MSNVLRIARWEWFKLRQRRMPWVLLAILLVFTQLAVWGSYVFYTSTVNTGGRMMLPFRPGAGGMRTVTCNELRSNPSGVVPAGTPQPAIDALLQQCARQGQRLAGLYRALQPAGAVSSALRIAATLELLLLGVLAAANVGGEYGLGTLRPILVRGTGRLAYLAGKYLLLVGAATAALLLACLAAAGSGLLAAHVTLPPPGGAPAAAALGDSVIPLLRTWGSLVTYLTIAGSLTLLLRSTAAGMAISLAWYVVERILIGLLSSIFTGFDSVANYLPMHNISALAAESPGPAPAVAAAVAAGAGAGAGAGGSITVAHAVYVCSACVILFGGAAAWVFHRRDITGAAGG